MNTLEEGWLKRQMAIAKKEYNELPDWMKKPKPQTRLFKESAAKYPEYNRLGADGEYYYVSPYTRCF